jgi:hypothetical protein
MRPAPTPASILRNVLQGLVGLLELSRDDDAFVTIPRFYLLVWEAQIQDVLRVLERPQP